MNSQPLLSILTPTIPRRAEQLGRLAGMIEESVARIRAEGKVEHRVLDDVPGEVRRLTVGEKRDRLMREALGKYVAFVDDDDWISPDYVRELLEVMEYGNHPEVITFRQFATVNDEVAVIEFRLGAPNEAFRGIRGAAETTEKLPVVRRNAWHVCAWLRELAILSRYPAVNYGEDAAWAKPLWELHERKALREAHIPKVLHFYRHSSATTAAPPPR